jgi:hypothetical protein
MEEVTVSRCEATTRKGSRCRNQASEDSRFCRVHAEQAERSGGEDRGPAATSRDEEFELFAECGEAARTVLGLAAVGVVVLIGMKLGRRF